MATKKQLQKKVNKLKKQLETAKTTASDAKAAQEKAESAQQQAESALSSGTQATYSTNALSAQAVADLTSALNAPERYRNTLGDYVAEGTQLRNDYADYMDYASVLGKYNDATDAAYALARQEQIQAMNAAEDQNYSNTKAAIQQMRQALAGSAASGAGRGAANATALQALLGLGSTNAQTTTAAMQGYQNVAKEMAAERAKNAVTALEFNKSATDSMYGNATSAYGSDMSALGQAAYGAGGGLGQTASAIDTNQTNNAMNNATNATNILSANVAAEAQKYAADQSVAAAKAGATQKITYKHK